MGKNASRLCLFTFLALFNYQAVVADKILVLKQSVPIAERPDLTVTTFSHQPQFKGFHTVVILKEGKKKRMLFRTINQNQPLIHHEYAVYWVMCEFTPGSDSDSDDESCKMELFDNACRFDLFPIREENEEKE